MPPEIETTQLTTSSASLEMRPHSRALSIATADEIGGVADGEVAGAVLADLEDDGELFKGARGERVGARLGHDLGLIGVPDRDCGLRGQLAEFQYNVYILRTL
jgi:hypothetical protein